MTGGSALAVLMVLAVGVGGALLLYVAVRSEHGRRAVTDRETAERIARRDTDEKRRGGP